jgi:hypothetical protein
MTDYCAIADFYSCVNHSARTDDCPFADDGDASGAGIDLPYRVTAFGRSYQGVLFDGAFSRSTVPPKTTAYAPTLQRGPTSMQRTTPRSSLGTNTA